MAFLSSFIIENFLSFRVRAYKGAAIVANLGINLEKQLNKPN